MNLDCYDHTFIEQVINSCKTVSHLNSCWDWIMDLGNKEIMSEDQVTHFGFVIESGYDILQYVAIRRVEEGPEPSPHP